jgi:metal-responsive CopG/Arc/MetJ family transcriptional regulator
VPNLGGVEVNLAITEAVLKKIDALAKKQGKSRSAILTEAVRRLIAAEKDHAA